MNNARWIAGHVPTVAEFAVAQSGAGCQNGPVTTFIVRLDQPGRRPRIAVKDLIDISGVPTTAGCKAVAATAAPATRDAACMAGAQAADAAIVGKGRLWELGW
jgi:hypothetical protein